LNLLDIIPRKAVVASLKARTKEGAVEELVDVLIHAKELPSSARDEVIRAVMKRERLGSTGIGAGLAVPHVKQSPHVPKIMGAFGRAPEGIEFGAIDGEPVHLLFLLLSPQGDPSIHLQALKMLSGLTRDENICKFLRAANNVDEIVETLSEVGEASGK
jgi:PTS system fructose-specific IIA component/PTS system nitrogen regulatory IIA component